MEDFKIIVSYSRRDAVADGVQMLLDSKITQEVGYKCPVYVSKMIIDLLNTKGRDKDGVIWDILYILYMSRKYIIQKISPSKHIFMVRFGTKDYRFICESTATDFDNAAPCIVIYHETED